MTEAQGERWKIAREIVEKLNSQRNRIAGGYDIPSDEPGPVALIADAIAAAERRGMEEAAKMVEAKAGQHSESRKGSPFLRNTTVEMLFRLADTIRQRAKGVT